MKPFTSSATYKNTKYECMHLIATNAHWAYLHAYYVLLKKRWADVGKPEVEDVIGMGPCWAYWYAVHILKQRWADIGKPEVEDVIGKDAMWAYNYAIDVLEQPWSAIGKPVVEGVIMKSEFWANYSIYFDI